MSIKLKPAKELTEKSLRHLQQQNQILQNKIKELETERDDYLRTLHAWAKEKITQEEVLKWMDEEKGGGSLAEVIQNLEKENRRHELGISCGLPQIGSGRLSRGLSQGEGKRPGKKSLGSRKNHR